MSNSKLKLVIVTGMSGAGKTVAMRCLEDAGFYCVDNLPPQLISQFSNLIKDSANDVKHVALAIDLRTLDVLETLPIALHDLENVHNIDYKIVFLDADEQVLVQRYKQSRRKHPLADDNSPLSAMTKERKLLRTVKEQADIIIDTTKLKPAQLQEKIMHNFMKKEANMIVNVMSFGFKYGIPLDADLVFDVRFLPNPHYVEHLRPKTGKDKEVASYVFDSDQTKKYLEKLVDFISFSLPQYKEEGKQQFVIAIGCTGGKHRSVAITEHLGKVFEDEYTTFTSHRDIGRE